MSKQRENEFHIKPGIIISDKTKDPLHPSKYRVIHLTEESAYLCRMDISKIEILIVGIPALNKLYLEQKISLSEPEQIVIDTSLLSEPIQKTYQRNRDIVQKISEVYGPDFLELQTKKPKPIYTELSRQYQVSTVTLRHVIRQYLQGGMVLSALIDERHFPHKRGYGKSSFKEKPGRKSSYISCGKILSEADLQHFDRALKNYKSGRKKTLKQCYDLMNAEYYSKPIRYEDGSVINKLLPVTERPTFDQFYYYVRKNLSKQEKDAIKTSRMEQRNNQRLLLSDVRYEVKGPCDRVQMDEVEVDVSLRSISDEIRVVGRPIVYIMHDVYSGIILAVSVAFDNNSVLGMTNCFLNLGEDKVEYCRKYGITISKNMWPSNVLPQRLLVDRGAEYRSNEAARIFNELNIHRELAPAGTGSMKGLVEQFFHEMHSSQNPYLENNGLITKRHDSNHHKEAALTIDEFTVLLLNFVIKRNQSVMKDYPLTKDMIANGVDPIPIRIWEYGCGKYGHPRPILNKAQYMFTLMSKQSAIYSRRGIYCNGLYYFNAHDPKLAEDMYNAGNKHISFDIRMDPRDIGAVYYMQDNHLQKASLNSKKTGQVDFAGMTLYEWNSIRHYLAVKRKSLEITKQQYDAYIAEVNTMVMKSAKKLIPASTQGMQENRRFEKNIIASRLSMFSEINKYLEDKTGGIPDLSYDLSQEQSLYPDADIEELPTANTSDKHDPLYDPANDPNCPDPEKDIDAYMDYIIGKDDYFQ